MESGVVPMTASAVIDTDMFTLSPADILSAGMKNMSDDIQECAYAVRHGSKPVRDFPPSKSSTEVTAADARDYFERSFPCLFPWGEGGFYRIRAVKLDFRDHVRWALRYADRRFRKHETFPFVAFGIVQRRQALASAKIQMKTARFRQESQLLRTVTIDKLRRAQAEEDAKKPISDPAIQALRKHVHGTLG